MTTPTLAALAPTEGAQGLSIGTARREAGPHAGDARLGRPGDRRRIRHRCATSPSSRPISSTAARGPLSRLAFLGLLSLALKFADTRFRYLEGVRQGRRRRPYPLQRAVQLPGEAFAFRRRLLRLEAGTRRRQRRARQELVAQAPAVQGYAQLGEETRG
jgi:hypothetical protein